MAWAKKILPNIPEPVATIEDAWKSHSSSKAIYLIQDAHTNTSGQFNVAKTLDLIFQKEPIKYVFLEAGSGNESLSFLRKYANPNTRKRIAESFLRQGKLQGSELADLTTDHNFILWGVEDLKLYAKSVETYRSVAKNRDKFEDYLNRIESTIKALKPKIYNPFLLSFDEKYQSATKSSADSNGRKEISLTEYFEILLNQANRLNVDLSAHPHLGILGKLKKLESEIDFQRYTRMLWAGNQEFLGIEIKRSVFFW